MTRQVPFYENMTSSTKPEVRITSQRRQKRTELYTAIGPSKNLVKIGHVVFEIYGQTDRQTNRQTHR